MSTLIEMKYQSTRGGPTALNFESSMLTGLAPDGGLYVPQRLPFYNIEELQQFKKFDYVELATRLLLPFVGATFSHEDFHALVNKAYTNFSHHEVAPVVSIEEGLWVLELFHGPTFAFKDFALQLFGVLLDEVLQRRGIKAVILGATSGDTGSAAIEGCRHAKNVDIFVLHPHKKISDVQRRQMTTVIADNVTNIAVEGNFDDCQRLVKSSFLDQSFLPDDRRLVAINSINWARIMAQTVYYFYSALMVGAPSRAVSFSVPTGNFGDIYAGFLAKRMGLPIDRLIIATNENDILHRCLQKNDYSTRPLIHSLSPSMDIMVSSNFERLLFDLSDRDGTAVVELMRNAHNGRMVIESDMLAKARMHFTSCRCDEEEMLQTIKTVWRQKHYLLDPHSAIGVAAARATRNENDAKSAIVALATAHPAKFPDAVKRVLPKVRNGKEEYVSRLSNLQERYETIGANGDDLRRLVRSRI